MILYDHIVIAWLLAHALITVIGIVMASVWLGRHKQASEPGYLGKLPWGLAIGILIAILIAGWYGAQYRGRDADAARRQEILYQATAIANTIDAELVKSLTFTIGDRTNIAFITLRKQMMAYSRAVGHRSIYSMAMRAGKIVFGPESLAEDDSMASPPGTLYERPRSGDWDCLKQGISSVFGPVADEYGTFVSAEAPVRDPRTGEVLMSVALDVVADDWQRNISREQIVPIRFAILLSLVVVLAIEVLGRRSLPRTDHDYQWRYSEVVITALFGLAVTISVTEWVNQAETLSRRELLRKMTDAETASIRHDLTSFDGNGAALARFMTSHATCTREEFRAFVYPMIKNSSVQAIEWLPTIRLSEREQFEESVKRKGCPGFRVFQQDDHGVPCDIELGREILYPVTFVEPMAGNERAIGFDLGSEPIRRQTLAVVESTGERLATAPIRLVQETGQQKGILVIYPVYSSLVDAKDAPIRGFALIVLRMGNVLSTALGQHVGLNKLMSVDLYQIAEQAHPDLLASYGRDLSANNPEIPRLDESYNSLEAGHVYPIFAFGRAFALVIRPGSGFMIAHPARSDWMAAIAGILLSIAAALVVGVLSRRQQTLERQVVERTAILAKERALLRCIIDSIPDLIFFKDLDSVYLGANESFLALIGLTEKDIIGKTDLDFMPHADAVKYREDDKRVVSSEKEIRTEEWVTYPNGRRVVVETVKTPFRDANGRVVGLVGISRDITVDKAAAEALQGKLKFRTLLNSLSRDLINPIDSMDVGLQKSLKEIGLFCGADRAYIFQLRDNQSIMDNTYEWCNEGISAQIQNLQDMPASIFPWWMDKLHAHETISISRVIDFPEEAKAEREILIAQGILSVLVVPLMHGPVLAGFVGFDAIRHEHWWTDDERELLRLSADMIGNALGQKRSRQSLMEAKDQAEAANQAQMMFIANISHEIRTPLNAIFGYAQIINDERCRADERQRGVETILKSAQQLLALINDVLSLSRLEMAGAKLQVSAFDIREMLSGLVDMIRPKAGKLNLVLDVTPAVPNWIVADEVKVRQVILNLLSNAAKFTESGSIHIEVKAQAPTQSPSVPAASPGLLVSVEVSDTGYGIAADEIPLVFEAFKQTQAGIKKQSGTGLGMALSRRFARLMKGDITVESTVGVGSVFRFTFMANRGQQPAVEHKLLMTPVQLARDVPAPRLLVVDDDESNRIMLCAMLAGVGFEVRSVSSGEEACRVAGAWHPDGILMDKIMPGMDGIEAMHRIKADTSGHRVVVIIVTAGGFGEEREEAIREGADGFIPKPIQSRAMLDELALLLKIKYVERGKQPVGMSPTDITPVNLADVPSDVRAAMRQAVRRGNVAEFRRLSESIISYAPASARKLRDLASRFAYTQILDLLNVADEETNKGGRQSSTGGAER